MKRARLARSFLFAAFTLLTASGTNAQTCPAWSIPTNGPNSSVYNLLRYNNKLITFGNFDTVGGVAAFHVAEFDGSAWTAMSAGLSPGYAPSAAFHASAVWGGKIYAAGSVGPFPLGGRGCVWNGSSWSPWGTNTPPGTLHAPTAVFALGDGRLLVDGSFYFYDDEGNFVHKCRLVTWNGSKFTPLSASQYGPRLQPDFSGQGVYEAVSYEGKVLMRTVAALSTGPNWNSTNIPLENGLCTFDGSSFAPFPAPALNGAIRCMILFNGELYVCGYFTATADNSLTLNHFARWSGGQWHKCGNGLTGTYDYMTVGDDGTGEKIHLLTTGTTVNTAYNDPNSTTNDTVQFRGVVRFDGNRFTTYGAANASGYTTSSAIIACTYDPGTGPALYFGGHGFQPGGPAANPTTYFARRGPAPSPDTDGDGLLDTWEQNGIDLNCDGVTDLDLPAMGANWRKKDVFVEVDSMNGRAPTVQNLDRVVAAFANANVDNVDGSRGINLHLILDPADQSIPLQDFPNIWDDFHPLKAERFGNAADRSGPNRQAILDAKRLAFRYCVFGNKFGTTSSSGVSELPGNDFMVTLGGARLPDNTPVPGGNADQQVGTFMHELGHTLGLYHGGHQNGEQFNFKPNYHSVMNYSWQLSWYRPGWMLDYSREVLPELDELHLDETVGIGGAPGAVTLASPGRQPVPESGPVDWNRDGDLDEDVVANINNMSGSHDSLDTLVGFHDWPNLFYAFRNLPNFANGESPEVSHTDNHLTAELQSLLDAAYAPPTCAADLGIAGGLPGGDGNLDNNDFIAFINYFFAHDAHADLGVAAGLPGSDGLYDNNDFIAFINHFFEGC